MSQLELMARIKQGQTKFQEPYKKMMQRIEAGNRVKWLNAIKTFFNVAEPVKWDQKSEEERRNIETASNEKIKTICKELCTEALNRDMCSWVTTGNEGNVGRDVYTSLA